MNINRRVSVYSFFILFFVFCMFAVHWYSTSLFHTSIEKFHIIMEQEDALEDLKALAHDKDILAREYVKTTSLSTLKELAKTEKKSLNTLKTLKKISHNSSWQSATHKLHELVHTFHSTIRRIVTDFDTLTKKQEKLNAFSRDIPALIKKLIAKDKTPKHRQWLNNIHNEFSKMWEHFSIFLQYGNLSNTDFVSHIERPLKRIQDSLNKLKTLHKNHPEQHTAFLNIERDFSTFNRNVISARTVISNIHSLQHSAFENTGMLMHQYIKNLLSVSLQEKRSLFSHLSDIKLTTNFIYTFMIAFIALFIFLLLYQLRHYIFTPLRHVHKALSSHIPLAKARDIIPPNSPIATLTENLEALTDKALTSHQDTLISFQNSASKKLADLITCTREFSHVSEKISEDTLQHKDKFSVLLDANEQNRISIRTIVRNSEALSLSLKSLSKDLPSSESHIPLIEAIVSHAHSAAIEAQNMNRRIKSIIKAESKHIAVSGLLVAACTKMNKIAQDIYAHMRSLTDKEESS